MNIVQIVPVSANRGEGVGGYASALGASLEGQGVGSELLVPEAGGRRGSRRSSSTSNDPARLASTVEALGASVVLLHYAGYGYATRGAPFWLARELAVWRARGRNRRLITIFHEIYATGPPWRSSFWYWPLQRRVAASLARRSDVLWTTLERYAAALRPWAGSRPVIVSPVFSTVGEPRAVASLSSRLPDLVIFGSAGVRQRAYASPESLSRACQALSIERIVDIGPALELPATIGAVPIVPRGILPARETSTAMLASRAGFLCYEPSFLPKSTIYAAYAAHGLLPVCEPLAGQPGLELREGEHYWRPDSESEGASSRWQAIAGAAHEWYSGHSLQRQAAALVAVLM